MKRGQKKKEVPCAGLQKTEKKEGSKKMKKLSGGQKEELPWVFFLQQCVVFYEICQQKVITKQRKVSFRWTAWPKTLINS